MEAGTGYNIGLMGSEAKASNWSSTHAWASMGRTGWMENGIFGVFLIQYFWVSFRRGALFLCGREDGAIGTMCRAIGNGERLTGEML